MGQHVATIDETARAYGSGLLTPHLGVCCTMKVIPLGDKVVVKRLEPEQTTAGGIVLPDGAQAKSQQGKVLSVGDGRALADGGRAAHQVAEGDRVVFDRYAGAELTVDGQQLLIMSEDEIIAVLG
jgi:chaperonin GroES